MPLSVSGGQEFSLSGAQKNERNILARLQRSHATKQLFQDLWDEREKIQAVVAHHLGLHEPSACNVQERDTWLLGQFNICIIVRIHGKDGTTFKKIFRCPMAHKVGERYSPGAVDEKIRAEVATYAWIETNCPAIPVPRLHGFGFSSDLQFTRRTDGEGYVQDPRNCWFDHPYLLLDYVDSEKGTPLSDTLRDFRGIDTHRMENLCRDISRIMLSLASKSQSNIGSLRFNNDGSIALASRPLFCAHSILESEGAPRVVDKTYKTSANFIDDLLQFREEAFRAQPNAVNDEEDCYLQILHMILLRRWKPQLLDSNAEGPFALQLTDFHANNIFVDDQWNIVALIDLEFVCALPTSMMSVPHWLSVDAIDEIGDQPDTFGEMHDFFMQIFRDQERSLNHEHSIQLASTIQDAWVTGSYWFYRCFTSINGMACCLEDHLYEKFQFGLSQDEERRYAKMTSSEWSSDPKAFVEQKLRDKTKYNNDMAQLFDEQDATRSKDAHISTAAA